MKARKRFSRVVASTLTLALLLGMLPMAAFAADPDYAPTVAELKNMTMENVLNAEEISLYSNGEMTNYFYRGINLSNNALVKVGYTWNNPNLSVWRSTRWRKGMNGLVMSRAGAGGYHRS